MCPSHPKPRIHTLCHGPIFRCLSGEYVVIPAHNNGATHSKESFSETFSTNLSDTIICFAYHQYVTHPLTLSGALYVPVKPSSQYCSRHFLQQSQQRQLSTKHHTPTRSHTLYFFTSAPISSTRPTISCHGTIGYVVNHHSLRA